MTWLSPTNLTTFHDYMIYANSLTDNYFWGIIVLLTFMIAFVVLMRYGLEKSLLASGFISSLIAILLRAGGYINEVFVFLPIILTAVTVLWVWAKSKN